MSAPNPLASLALVGGRTNPVVELRCFVTMKDLAMALSQDLPVEFDNKVEVSLEKAQALEAPEDHTLPDKIHGRALRNLRFQVLSLYRRFFGVTFVINMSVFLAMAIRRNANAQSLGLIALANFFTAVIMRQEHVINAFYAVFTAVPTSWPFWIRNLAGQVYTIGGIHSGCGVSGTIWLIFYCAQATRELVQGGPITLPTLVISYLILSLLVFMIVFAHPFIRYKLHDRFEQTHRFMGWTALCLLWAQSVLLTKDFKAPHVLLRTAFLGSPAFWLVLAMTVAIISPWPHLRQLPTRSEILSDHAVRLYFDYDQPAAGSYVRLSTSPLLQWHSFATISEPGKTGFSLIVSNSGDWTGGIIAAPPPRIWVRGIPTMGMMRVVRLFRRVVVVATGSGIGPCAPHIFEKKVQIKLLWTAPDVRQTFGDKLVDQIMEAAPDAIIYDTRKRGRPDMVELVYSLVEEYKPEAVFIVSNRSLTYKVVYGMESRGIPAYGPIWDH